MKTMKNRYIISATIVFSLLLILTNNVKSQNDLMLSYFKNNEMEKIAEVYSDSAKIVGSKVEVHGKESIKQYWRQLQDNGITWDNEITSLVINDGMAVQTGISKLEEDFQGYADLWFGRVRQHVTDFRWEQWLKDVGKKK